MRKADGAARAAAPLRLRARRSLWERVASAPPGGEPSGSPPLGEELMDERPIAAVAAARGAAVAAGGAPLLAGMPAPLQAVGAVVAARGPPLPAGLPALVQGEGGAVPGAAATLREMAEVRVLLGCFGGSRPWLGPRTLPVVPQAEGVAAAPSTAAAAAVVAGARAVERMPFWAACGSGAAAGGCGDWAEAVPRAGARP